MGLILPVEPLKKSAVVNVLSVCVRIGHLKLDTFSDSVYPDLNFSLVIAVFNCIIHKQ